MSGFMKTTRLGSSISRLESELADPQSQARRTRKPRGTGPLKCGTWKGVVLARHEFRCESGATS